MDEVLKLDPPYERLVSPSLLQQHMVSCLEKRGFVPGLFMWHRIFIWEKNIIDEEKFSRAWRVVEKRYQILFF